MNLCAFREELFLWKVETLPGARTKNLTIATVPQTVPGTVEHHQVYITSQSGFYLKIFKGTSGRWREKDDLGSDLKAPLRRSAPWLMPRSTEGDFSEANFELFDVEGLFCFRLLFTFLWRGSQSKKIIHIIVTAAREDSLKKVSESPQVWSKMFKISD